MKKHFVCLICAAMLVSCANDELATIENAASANDNKAEWNGGAYDFSAVTAPEVWRGFESLEEMFAACQVPDSILKRMTTEELVETCMNHPLQGIFTAYNNQMDGINVLKDNFNGFKELQSREDAAEVLLDYYESLDATSVVTSSASVSREPVGRKLPLLHLSYVELLVASEIVPDMFEGDNAQRAAGIAQAKYEAKRALSNIYSSFSTKNSLLVNVKAGLAQGFYTPSERRKMMEFVDNGGNLNQLEMLSSGYNVAYITVYTHYGKAVEAMHLSPDFTTEEKAEFNQSYQEDFPSAVILSDATWAYNCHSYAWNMSEGG